MENLSEFLIGMDLPEQRKTDLRWLFRNLSIRNHSHKNCEAAMKLIKKLILQQEI